MKNKYTDRQLLESCLNAMQFAQEQKVPTDWQHMIRALKEHLPKHSGSCSNQNVLNPVGAYIGVEACGCRTPS